MFEILHGVTDEAKVTKLAADMEERGWVGAPLVNDGYELLTGVHRYTAANRLGWDDSDIPVIDIRDVFAKAGLDFDEIHAEFGSPAPNEGAFVDLLFELPDDIRDEFGIDMH